MKPLSENRIPSPDNYRKVSKPLIEKKRRARINASLNELKQLLETVLGAEIPRDSKMEKADILELAVRHLRRINTPRVNGGLVGEYRTGYGECATETSRFLGNVHGLDSQLRTRIMNHLANNLNNNPPMTSYVTSQTTTSRHVDFNRVTTPLHVHVNGQYSNNVRKFQQPISDQNKSDVTMVKGPMNINVNYAVSQSNQSSGLLMTSPIVTSHIAQVKSDISIWRPW